MANAEAAARLAELSLPATSQAARRFTALKVFGPAAFGHARGTGPGTRPVETMLEVDVAAFGTVSEDGISIERAPDGITFAPLSEEHERLYSLVGWNEKFAAHNAALWEHGLLVHVPKGVVVEQ